MYTIKNTRTNKTTGTYKTRQAARDTVDRLDNQYGAYVHKIVLKENK